MPGSLSPARRADLAARLGQDILADIPLARAMDVAVSAWDGDSLVLAAPLAPNVNDKGCAFGGSLASVMTLAGWGLIRLAQDAHGLAADLYVQDSALRYLAPVWEDFSVVARLAPGEAFAPFLDALGARGKARLRVECVVALADGTPAATLAARFVALARA
jgi:thioesterase domain-containing protein